MESFVTIRDTVIHYRDSGEPDLPPVILMHGWGCRLETLESVEALFRGKMRTVNIDLPGHGRSSEPPAVWGVADFADVVKELVSRLGLKSPALVGHSFGGRIAVLLASESVTGKVLLIDAAGIKPKRSLGYYRKVYSFKALKFLVLLFLGRKRGSAVLDRIRSKSGSADYRSSSPRMRAIMSRCVNEDLRYAMPSVKAPVLLFWGEEDTATPLADALVMKSLIPNASLVALPGCGHYSFLDNPFAFKASVSSFFNL